MAGEILFFRVFCGVIGGACILLAAFIAVDRELTWWKPRAAPLRGRWLAAAAWLLVGVVLLLGATPVVPLPALLGRPRPAPAPAAPTRPAPSRPSSPAS